MNESEAGVEVVGDGGSTLGTAGIGGDDDAVLGLVVLADVAEERRLGVEVIDGDAEEAFLFSRFVSTFSISSSWDRSIANFGTSVGIKAYLGSAGGNIVSA